MRSFAEPLEAFALRTSDNDTREPQHLADDVEELDLADREPAGGFEYFDDQPEGELLVFAEFVEPGRLSSSAARQFSMNTVCGLPGQTDLGFASVAAAGAARAAVAALNVAAYAKTCCRKSDRNYCLPNFSDRILDN